MMSVFGEDECVGGGGGGGGGGGAGMSLAEGKEECVRGR